MESTKFTVPNDAKVLPNVLSKEEIKLILDAHSNIKQNDVLLIYSCGFVVAVLALEPVHIDSRNIVLQNSKEKG
jgi:integrase/recombinase XerD